MHSERPLIKIISTGDGQGRERSGRGGVGGEEESSLADVKSHLCYLIYPKSEAGNPAII